MTTDPPLLEPAPQPLPYATPAGYDAAPGVAWRQGSRVGVTTGPVRYVRLPPRCVKCNATGDDLRSFRRNLYWHHWGYFFLILLNLLIYGIVALAVRRKVTVEGCLCAAHRRQRRGRTLIGWAILAVAVALVPAALFFTIDPGWKRTDMGPICFLAALVAGLAAGVWAVVAVRLVSVNWIAGPTVWLAGAGPAFLASLPSA